MSLASILSIARSALSAHQQAVNVTSHNIANASTEGYSRQSVPLQAATPVKLPSGIVGRGVTALATQRSRSAFLDASYRRESGLSGQFDELRTMLGQVESVFGEPGDGGLADVMDGLWSAFGDLANDPAGSTQRSLLREAATTLVQRFRATDQRLGEIDQSVTERMTSTVAEVNSLATQIADVNRQILGLGAMRSSPDLADQRDLLVDKMSKLMNVRVVEHGDGTIGVLAGESLLVDGTALQQLAVRTAPGGGVGIGVGNAKELLDPGTGSLKALVEMSQTQMPAARRQLDQLARSLVQEVNRAHAAGKTPSGETGIDFFDPTGLTAGTIALGARIVQSPNNIAAGTDGSSGDGTVALGIAGLRTAGLAGLGGQTLSEFYTGMVSTLGVITRTATEQSSAQETVLANVKAQRSSVSDVSVDEEMVNLTRQQQAYAAAARLVTIANEMMDDVLKMV